MENDKNYVILTENVTKTYKEKYVEVKALEGISIKIASGEFTAIVGASGSGKTTFLNLISGIDRVTKGDIWLNGKLISKMKSGELADFRRDNIGFIFQSYNLIPVLNVMENIEYGMILQRINRNERHKRVMEMLNLVNLNGYEKRHPPKLSGGEQQRVAIARAMVTKPLLILADEPTANLDSKTGSMLLDMMRELNRKTKVTFLFSTHDPMIMEKADRIITLKDGQVVDDEVKAVSQ
ncbi:MAG: ABC transporter ATP-binding protein [Spirochaetales bacterium]|nr:ABC transporter ATP-binding protein [Spirochaetales bacterium]